MRIVLVGLVVMGLLFVAPAWVSAPVGWMLFGYLLTRAWPGVRADLSRVRGVPVVSRRRRGEFL